MRSSSGAGTCAAAWCGLWMAAGQAAVAATLYVSPGNPTPAPPFASWAAAATSIQDAVDQAGPGDVVLVTNGTYATGGRVAPGFALTNRVLIDKTITVRSVNGRGSTFIQGSGPIGPAAVRGVWMTNGAVLEGFTIMGGATLAALSNDGFGGGVAGGTVRRCQLADNHAHAGGGGAAGGIVDACIVNANSSQGLGGGLAYASGWNCLILGNQAVNVGGGFAHGALYGCTVSGNSSDLSAGGVFGGITRNSIVAGNYAPADTNYPPGATITFSCTTPAHPGAGNITGPPGFVDVLAGDYRLRRDSPCVDAGSNAEAAGPADLAGNPRILGGRTDMGAYEAPIRASAFNRDGVITTVDTNFATPNPSVIRVGGVTGAVAAIRVTLHGLQHTYPDDLDVILVSPPFVEGVKLMSDAGTSVALTNATLTFADDAAVSLPDSSPITNGVYRPTDYEADAFGGIAFVTNLASLLSAGVNGDWHLFIYDDAPGDTGSVASWEIEFEWYLDPTQHFANVFSSDPAWPYLAPANASTTIQDAVDAATSGDVVRVAAGVYETGGRPAPGYGLTNRVLIDKPIRVESESGPDFTTIRGAGPEGDHAVRGVWLADGAALVGLTVTGGNTRVASGFGPDLSGGGVFCAGSAAAVSRCRLLGNQADGDGGNVYGGHIANSLLAGGSAGYGGGANFYGVGGRLDNCTVVGNLASQGGGMYDGEANNCLFRDNTAGAGADVSHAYPTYSCGPTIPGNTGNLIASPVFVNAAAGDFRLHPSSPGLEAGDDASAAGPVDLAGNVRIIGSHVDMGAFEYVGFTVDTDGDTFSDYDEYVAGTQETNAGSFFQSRVVRFSGGPPEVEFTGISGRVYTVESATNLMPPAVWSASLRFTSTVDSVFGVGIGPASREFRRVTVGLVPP